MSAFFRPDRPSRHIVQRSGPYAVFVRILLAFLPFVPACSALTGEPTACDGLVYKEFGLTRSEYLPCAGEMMAMLDRLGPQIDAMLAGDGHEAGQAWSTLQQLRKLLKRAGGRNLLERWEDRALTDLNVQIWNAVTQHEACLMVASAPSSSESLVSRQRAAIASQCRAYRVPYEEATRAYRSLR